MNCEFMHKKFNFSIQGRAIFFARPTTLILPDPTLNFFNLNSIPSPFPLFATPFHIPINSSSWTLAFLQPTTLAKTFNPH